MHTILYATMGNVTSESAGCTQQCAFALQKSCNITVLRAKAQPRVVNMPTVLNTNKTCAHATTNTPMDAPGNAIVLKKAIVHKLQGAANTNTAGEAVAVGSRNSRTATQGNSTKAQATATTNAGCRYW